MMRNVRACVLFGIGIGVSVQWTETVGWNDDEYAWLWLFACEFYLQVLWCWGGMEVLQGGGHNCWWPCGMGWFVVKSWVAAWRRWLRGCESVESINLRMKVCFFLFCREHYKKTSPWVKKMNVLNEGISDDICCASPLFLSHLEMWDKAESRCCFLLLPSSAIMTMTS